MRNHCRWGNFGYKNAKRNTKYQRIGQAKNESHFIHLCVKFPWFNRLYSTFLYDTSLSHASHGISFDFVYLVTVCVGRMAMRNWFYYTFSCFISAHKGSIGYLLRMMRNVGFRLVHLSVCIVFWKAKLCTHTHMHNLRQPNRFNSKIVVCIDIDKWRKDKQWTMFECRVT